MTTRIRQLHWGKLPPGTAAAGLKRWANVVAIWPAPVDADACFVAAGFQDFADSDEEWDRQWRSIVVRAIQHLQQLGQPRVLSEAAVYELGAASAPRRLLARIRPQTAPREKGPLSLVDQIVAVTGDGRFGRVLVEFDTTPKACLLAGQGHPILWVGWDSMANMPEAFVADAAGELPAVQTKLKWQALLPKMR